MAAILTVGNQRKAVFKEPASSTSKRALFRTVAKLSDFLMIFND